MLSVQENNSAGALSVESAGNMLNGMVDDVDDLRVRDRSLRAEVVDGASLSDDLLDASKIGRHFVVGSGRCA